VTTLLIGSGLVGSQIARILVEGGERPVILDVSPQPESLADIVDLKQVRVVHGDVLNPLDLVRIIRESEITRVVHTAANPMLTLGAQQNPYSAIQLNILGTVNVLETARAHGLQRVVVASSGVLSSMMTGGEDEGDITKEEGLARPSTIYGATKQAGENLGLNYARWFGVDFVAVRFAAVAGPWRGRGGGGPSVMFRELVEDALSGKEVTIQPRAMEWVYSKDAARGTVLALKAGGLKSRVFNIGMGRAYGGQELIDAVKEAIPEARIRLAVEGEGKQAIMAEQPVVMDMGRSRRELGYTPQYDMPAAVRDYVKWYRGRKP
jgi:nucleoside-diphosphate-sugar epimerase